MTTHYRNDRPEPTANVADPGPSNPSITAADRTEEDIVRVEDLPDDPLAMPPPYWRSSGAIFHVLVALRSISKLLSKLPNIVNQTERKPKKHYERYPGNSESDPAMAEFSDICDGLWELEHAIKLDAEHAILMASISAEDEVNQFCVFNLHRDIAETIEKLSLPEKLLVASGTLGKHGLKSTDVYEKARKLVTWRNAFAHGHCVDRPVKSLRHNHLISPDEYPGVPSAVVDTRELVGAFLAVSRYLKSISRNEYTASDSYENAELEKSLEDIGRYSFVGNEDVYSVSRGARSRRHAKARSYKRAGRSDNPPTNPEAESAHPQVARPTWPRRAVSLTLPPTPYPDSPLSTAWPP